MKILLNICGLRQADDESDETNSIGYGTLERIAEGWKLSYNEDESSGLADVYTTLFVYKDYTVLKRNGAVRMEMELRPGQLTSFDYCMEFGSFQFKTKAKVVESSISKFGGKIELCYSIITPDGAEAEHQIRITYTPANI